VDVLIEKSRRGKVFGEIMVVLSIFDLFGSVGCALTTLPLPIEDHIAGSIGNDTSCSVQGFLIQLGTTSAYVNVALAFYYLLVIKYNWRENRLAKIKIWLFACPIAVGLALAFSGIPYYENIMLWCNNAARYWPDIPVAIAILLATAIMASLCLHVYREEKRSQRWRQHNADSGRNTLTGKVVWQSIFYLMAFYLTWPPYLALQYTLAARKAYSSYGFFLFAGAVVPLQGFWNCIVYLRTRNVTVARLGSRILQIGSALKSRILERSNNIQIGMNLSNGGAAKNNTIQSGGEANSSESPHDDDDENDSSPQPESAAVVDEAEEDSAQ